MKIYIKSILKSTFNIIKYTLFTVVSIFTVITVYLSITISLIYVLNQANGFIMTIMTIWALLSIIYLSMLFAKYIPVVLAKIKINPTYAVGIISLICLHQLFAMGKIVWLQMWYNHFSSFTSAFMLTLLLMMTYGIAQGMTKFEKRDK